MLMYTIAYMMVLTVLIVQRLIWIVSIMLRLMDWWYEFKSLKMLK